MPDRRLRHAWKGTVRRLLWSTALAFLAIGGMEGAYGQSNSQKHDVTIKVGNEATFDIGRGPEIILGEPGRVVEGTSTYDFANKNCGQGRGGNNPCWKVEAEIESGDKPSNVTLRVELDAPSTENQNRNSPSSTGFQTLEEQNAKILLEDIGNTEVTGLDVTYEAESTVEAVPGDYEVTVVYTLLEDT